MGRRAGWIGWWCTIVALALVVGLGWLPLARVNGWMISGGSSTISDDTLKKLQPAPKAAEFGPAPILTPSPADPGKLAGAVDGVPTTIPGSYSEAAGNLNASTLSHVVNGDAAMVPASTLKIMTATSTLKSLGAGATFATTVVAGPAAVGQPLAITLVGGGDPLLATGASSHPYASDVVSANLEDLASRTAEKLRGQGIAEVTLSWDDSLFQGPDWHSTWPAGDRAWVAPVTALGVDLGNPAKYREIANPSEGAAKNFADLLRVAGLKVTGDPAGAKAPAGASELTRVESAASGAMVEQMLVHSDNYIAEVLARQVALANGQPATFDGGAAAQQAILRQLGLWTEGQRIVDGSGLSTDNRLTATNLARAVQMAAADPVRAPLLDALPVAAATGTLLQRFADDQSAPARGEVRAKTGTLDQVSALAGYTKTNDGAVVAFAFIGNGMPLDQDPRPWFDHVSAAIAGCHCAG